MWHPLLLAQPRVAARQVSLSGSFSGFDVAPGCLAQSRPGLANRRREPSTRSPQGLGYISGSFMTGATLWAVIGPVIALAGLGIVALGFRGRRVR